jgi:predicted AAA+ superfamily ATPase
MKFPMDFWAMRKKKLFFTGKESVMIARGSYKERILKICLNAELNGLLLLDEFQFIQGISTMLKLLTDKFGNLRILCSGSSSLDILQNIEESLMGRVRVIEVLSLSLGLSFVD